MYLTDCKMSVRMCVWVQKCDFRLLLFFMFLFFVFLAFDFSYALRGFVCVQ